jgi:hypothetical protein
VFAKHKKEISLIITTHRRGVGLLPPSVYVFISHVKITSKIKKNNDGFKIAGFLLLKFFGYEVFAKQKKRKRLTYHYFYPHTFPRC